MQRFGSFIIKMMAEVFFSIEKGMLEAIGPTRISYFLNRIRQLLKQVHPRVTYDFISSFILTGFLSFVGLFCLTDYFMSRDLTKLGSFSPGELGRFDNGIKTYPLGSGGPFRPFEYKMRDLIKLATKDLDFSQGPTKAFTKYSDTIFTPRDAG